MLPRQLNTSLPLSLIIALKDLPEGVDTANIVSPKPKDMIFPFTYRSETLFYLCLTLNYPLPFVIDIKLLNTSSYQYLFADTNQRTGSPVQGKP